MPGVSIQKTSPHPSLARPQAVVRAVMPGRELTAYFLLAWLFLVCLDRPFVQAEKWTSLSGNRTVEATMVGMWDNQVVLVLTGGRKINVPMDSLIAESRIQAGQLAARLQQQREALTSEIKKVAEEAAAPAPNPLAITHVTVCPAAVQEAGSTPRLRPAGIVSVTVASAVVGPIPPLRTVKV